MKRTILIIATLIGFLVPIFWDVVAMINFTEPEGPTSDRFWHVVYLTCPPWPIAGPFAVPFLNALLYGGVVGFVLYIPMLWRVNGEH